VVAEGEEVLLHGLVARSELNGMTAVISGKLDSESGRYPTSVSMEKDMMLAIKPSNFHRLGARLEYVATDGGAGEKRARNGGAVVKRVMCAVEILKYQLSSNLLRQRTVQLTF
jgi:hypothetical protein